MIKTNAMRILDAAKIAYTTKEFDNDESNVLQDHSIKQLGIAKEEIFKTLVTRGDKTGITIFCIPLELQLDLKKCASVSGNKKIEMVHVKEMLGLTGYVRGACSPVGMKKKYPTYIDETAILYNEIGVSAGAHGCELVLNGEVLATFVDATLCDITK